MSEYRVGLGGIYCIQGSWHKNGPRPADSLPWFQKATDTLRPLYDAGSRDVTLVGFLRTAHWHRAEAYESLGKFEAAVKDWDRVLEVCAKSERWEFRQCRARSLALAGRVDEAVGEVAELRKPPHAPWDGDTHYNFAKFYAILAGKSADKKQEYADAAMDMLKQAVKSGYKDVATLKEDKNLDPLRDRDDFKKLLAGLK